MPPLTLLAMLACGDAPADLDADLAIDAGDFANPADADPEYDPNARTKDEAGSFNGMFNYCDGVTTCDAGEGDCDTDDQCTGTLVCANNTGAQFGLRWSVDVCLEEHCDNGIQDLDETSIDVGGADCGECGGTNGDTEGYCSESCPCIEGEGDCDSNDECAPGFTCSPNRGADYGFPAAHDICLADIGEAAMVSGDLVITEVMNNPAAVDDSVGEYFEIYNASGRTIDLDGMVVRDDGVDSFTVSGTLVVPPKAYIAFARDADELVNGGFTGDYDYAGSMSLANGDDEVILETSGGVEIDRIEYDGGPNWPDLTGEAMVLGRANLLGDNNDGANWCPSPIAAPLYLTGPDKGSPGFYNVNCP